MSIPEFTLNPELADELKSLRRDKQYDGAPVVLEATAERDDANAVLAEIERLPGPVVLAVSGPLDATALALCCACTVAYAEPDTTLAEIDPAAALSLGLAGRLTERLGPGAAVHVLCNPQGHKGHGVAIVAADPLAAARATAARLAESGAALLLRSLAFAARSTRAQAAAYDQELLALLTDREI